MRISNPTVKRFKTMEAPFNINHIVLAQEPKKSGRRKKIAKRIYEQHFKKVEIIFSLYKYCTWLKTWKERHSTASPSLASSELCSWVSRVRSCSSGYSEWISLLAM
jgi:hypothetical protein